MDKRVWSICGIILTGSPVPVCSLSVKNGKWKIDGLVVGVTR